LPMRSRSDSEILLLVALFLCEQQQFALADKLHHLADCLHTLLCETPLDIPSTLEQVTKYVRTQYKKKRKVQMAPPEENTPSLIQAIETELQMVAPTNMKTFLPMKALYTCHQAFQFYLPPNPSPMEVPTAEEQSAIPASSVPSFSPSPPYYNHTPMIDLSPSVSFTASPSTNSPHNNFDPAVSPSSLSFADPVIEFEQSFSFQPQIPVTTSPSSPSSCSPSSYSPSSSSSSSSPSLSPNNYSDFPSPSELPTLYEQQPASFPIPIFSLSSAFQQAPHLPSSTPTNIPYFSFANETQHIQQFSWVNFDVGV